MPRLGFEHMIPAFERTKIVYALDSTTTVISGYFCPVEIFSGGHWSAELMDYSWF
jgi:hypothetical protein